MPAKKQDTEMEQRPDQLSANMRFYSKVMTTPKEAQKSFNNGSFSGTDINPMYRIQKLTELFGPVGFGWWTKNVEYKFEHSEATNEIHVFCELELYVRDPETGIVSEPIYGIGGNTYLVQRKTGPKASDEAMKMAYTDAMSIACKALGIGHDIWYANDRTKYTLYGEEPVKPKTENLSDIQAGIQKGLQYLTKNMTSEQKTEFVAKVIVPTIGQEDYRKCTDAEKLMNLLTKLREMAAKKAA